LAGVEEVGGGGALEGAEVDDPVFVVVAGDGDGDGDGDGGAAAGDDVAAWLDAGGVSGAAGEGPGEPVSSSSFQSMSMSMT